MGTPYSKDYTEDQKQIAKLTFQARQFLCCVGIDDEGQATLPNSMLKKYQALVEEAEDYLRNAAVNQASAVAAARADEREKACKAMCGHCRVGYPVGGDDLAWHVYGATAPRNVQLSSGQKCAAAAIRNMGAMEEKGE